MTAEERETFAKLFGTTLRHIMEERGYDMEPSIHRGARAFERDIRRATGMELSHRVIANLLEGRREPTYGELVLIDSTLGAGWFTLAKEGK